MALSLLSSASGFSAPLAAAPVNARASVSMRYMYDEPYAPEGMGREFINADGVRKPIEAFVGASEEMDLAGYFRGADMAQADWAAYGRVGWRGKLIVRSCSRS